MWLNAALAALTLLYPLAVYFGLQHWQPRNMGLLLAAVLALRLLLGRNSAGVPTRSLLMGLLVFAVAVYWANDESLLRFYPVLMNALMLLIFGYTLISPPSLIERLARLRMPEMDSQGVRYTRIVTQVWCGFFVLNGAVAAWTATRASLAWWTLYNGLISYFLMGLLFVSEYLVRQRVRGRQA